MTNQYVDYALVSNFQAFAEVVDAVGGINVYLDQDFEEPMQWAQEGWVDSPFWEIREFDDGEKWVFAVPKGNNWLNGTTTLYYVRSRFSSSDFDRIRRQQQVIFAIKDKALSLGVLANPVKIYNLMDIAGKNIRTDIPVTKIPQFLDFADDFDMKNVKKIVLDTTPEGYLYETFHNSEYVLLPVGDNFDKIREVIGGVFNNNE
jgi:anionic cell wall polymer biosynthesis LytR-Cps2A-Psr (LCP) family protein